MKKLWNKLPEDSKEKEVIKGPGSFRNANGRKGQLGNKIELQFGTIKRITITMFAIFINGFMGLVLAIVLYFSSMTVEGIIGDFLKGLVKNPSTLLFSIFPLIGLTVAYVATAMWVNKTSFKRTKKGITISRGPLPWPNSNLLIKKSKTKQCFVESYVRTRSQRGGTTSLDYRVVALQKNNDKIVIVNGMHSYNDARILEQWLEEKLSIEDLAVEGEVI